MNMNNMHVIGDLTPHGFQKKKAQICEKYEYSASVPTSSVLLTSAVLSSASAIASKVSTSAHTTLSKIFVKSSKGTIKKKIKAKAT